MRSVSEVNHHAPNRSTGLQQHSVGFDSRNESPTKFDVIDNSLNNNLAHQQSLNITNSIVNKPPLKKKKGKSVEPTEVNMPVDDKSGMNNQMKPKRA